MIFRYGPVKHSETQGVCVVETLLVRESQKMPNMSHAGHDVTSSGLGFWGSGFRVKGSGCWVKGLGLMV